MEYYETYEAVSEFLWFLNLPKLLTASCSYSCISVAYVNIFLRIWQHNIVTQLHNLYCWRLCKNKMFLRFISSMPIFQRHCYSMTKQELDTAFEVWPVTLPCFLTVVAIFFLNLLILLKYNTDF